MSQCQSSGCGCSSTPAPLVQLQRPTVSGAPTLRYRIDNMDCPSEEALIRARLSALEGVLGLEFNLLQRTLSVQYSLSDRAPLEQALAAIGMHAQRLEADARYAAPLPPAAAALPWRLVAALLVALGAELFALRYGEQHPLVLFCALLAIGVGGLATYRKGWIALTQRNLNMNALMSLAVSGALLIGAWPEAAMVMVLFTLAELIEAKSLTRAQGAIQQLLELAPAQVNVLQADGCWSVQAAQQVALGARVRVKPGERIALDGRIVSGQSSINQAPITGESLPVEKTLGDCVFAGTLNLDGSFEYQVTATAEHSVLSRIQHSVEQAHAQRAPFQRWIDQFAQRYTPVVFGLALMIAVLPPLWQGGGWLLWLYNALVVLVIACPCALVISTPVTIVSALTAAARQGMLIKGGQYLEQGRQLRILALDKTGTLTYGQAHLVASQVADHSPEATFWQQQAASLASYSDHPLSQALVRASATLARLPVAHYQAHAGYGVQGEIAGQCYYLANRRWLEQLHIGLPPALLAHAQHYEQQGYSVVWLSDTQQARALFAFSDTVKSSSREALRQLHALGVHTVMLSGDQPVVAQAVARELGIDEVRANLLPDAKLQAVRELSQRGMVGMVGDGINDAPALAGAPLGFAMGALGSATALETADVALMDDDLQQIPRFIRLSQATMRILWQNIGLALGIKLLFLGLALAGMASMWLAVLADMGTSLLVVANGLRVLHLRWKE